MAMLARPTRVDDAEPVRSRLFRSVSVGWGRVIVPNTLLVWSKLIFGRQFCVRFAEKFPRKCELMPPKIAIGSRG